MKIYSIFATLTALVCLGLYCLSTVHMLMGGGQYESSPNKLFEANASSLRDLNPLSRSTPHVYYEFSVTKGDDPPFKRIVLYPSEKNGDIYFRNIPKIIRWAEDSSEVTFTIPGATLKIDMKDHPEARN